MFDRDLLPLSLTPQIERDKYTRMADSKRVKGRAEREREKIIKIAHKVLRMGLGNRSPSIKEQEQSTKGGATIKGFLQEEEN